MQNKFEIAEVNIAENTVTVRLRGDLLGTVAKCLRWCADFRKQVSAARTLGDELSCAGDLLFGAEDPEDQADIAARIVLSDGRELASAEAA